jgi:hypothetical protein
MTHFSWLQHLTPAALWRRFSRLLIGRSVIGTARPVEPGYITSRLCPTVALQSVPVRPERRRPRAR